MGHEREDDAPGTASAPAAAENDQTSVWRALGDPTRRALLDLLREAPRTTGDLTGRFPEGNRINVIKHLKVLEKAGLVRVEPRGRERWNHLDVVPLQEIHERWLRPYEAVWAGRLWRLREVAEAGEGEEAMASPALRLVEIDLEIDIRAKPGRVFVALTEEIGSWWGPPYVASDDRVGLTLDLRPGGFVWEDWGDGQGTAWAQVSGFRRDARIDFTGTFRMTGAVDGIASFELVPDGGGTRVRVTQRAIGAIPEGTEARWAAGWRELIGQQMSGYLRGDRR